MRVSTAPQRAASLIDALAEEAAQSAADGAYLPDEAERLGLAAAGRLRTEALLLRAPPSRCNAEAVAAPWGTVLPALWRDELIAGASHCDFESPTDWMCRLACGDTDPARQQQVRQGLLDAAARWLR